MRTTVGGEVVEPQGLEHVPVLGVARDPGGERVGHRLRRGLEAQVKDHEQKVAKGLLVDKVVYDKMERQMSTELLEERKRRAEAERLKRNTDSEVEQLTAALFEEANVVGAASSHSTRHD